MRSSLRGSTLGLGVLALAVALCAAQPARAVSVDYQPSSVSVFLNNAHTATALALWTDTSVLDTSLFTLDDGGSYSFDAFTIGSDDTRTNGNQSGLGRPVSATITFSLPAIAGGTITGTAFATWKDPAANGDTATLAWSGPVSLSAGGAQFEITLSDASFTLAGSQLVQATVTQLSSSPMPEPDSAALFGVGAVLVAGAIRRWSD